MNRILNIIIALVAVLSGYCTALAQGDAPIVREGVKWLYEQPPQYGSGKTDYYYLYFKGTETINGKEYKVCYRQYLDSAASAPKKFALLRQEGGKVFRYMGFDGRRGNATMQTGSLPYGESEMVIYDFSLNTGESWKLLPNSSDDLILREYGYSNKKVVDSVKYTKVKDIDTKVQYIKHFGPELDHYTTPVIEGIGCIMEKEFPFPYPKAGYLYIYSIYPLLKSFEDMNGNVLWKNNLGVSSVEESGATMTMEDDLLSVTAESGWTVTVYGSDGRKVMQRKGYGSDAIALDGLGAGIYIARLQTATAAKTLKLIR